jgi:hypothetical protein
MKIVDQALGPVRGLRGIKDLLSIQLDAADDRRARRIACRLGDDDRGKEQQGKSEGEAAGQKRLRELNRM